MKNTAMKKSIMVFFLIVPLMFPAAAQEKKAASTTPELYHEIAAQDSMMFAAFNKQDMNAFKVYFSKELEWFQDNGGLIHYDTVMMNFDNNFFKKNLQLKRELIKSTLEVHPIKDYGAIETGSHRFKHFENGKEEIGTFKFLMIWKKENERWVIMRVVSYDH